MTATSWRIACGLLAMACAGAPASAAGWTRAGPVTRVDKLADGVELAAGEARLRITAPADGVLRVRLAPHGRFDDTPSWTVVQAPDPPRVVVEDGDASVRVEAGALVATVRKSPLLVEVAGSDGTTLLADMADAPMAWNGDRVRAWKRITGDTHFYGLGDKAGPIDRRGRAFVNWNTDAYAWQESTDPLYKSIPFFIGLRHGVAYGVFLDNTWRSTFDFGQADPDVLSFGADGGELDYYVIAGPEPARVIERYTALTGRMPLPPLWALGYQQSRYTYVPEARVREVAARLRRDRIPADAIYLDIDYQRGHAPFTVDRDAFPHFEDMIADLHRQGLRTVLITDLHIKRDPGNGYAPYDSGVAADAFVKNPDGSTYVGKVWPGDSVFPDFTLSRVRDWWGGLYRDFVAMGADGFWNDMDEPSVFGTPDKTMPPDTVHRLDDGSSRDHRAIHNVYGMENARATYEGVLKLRPDARPFVLTRAAFAGTQRYAASWTGDNQASWNHLSMSTPMLLGLGLSGYALVGDDIGGFIGSPTPDLLTRWFELGAFNPLFRSHAATDTRPHEPWADGAGHEAIRRRYIELRYRLLPYLYTVAEEASRDGMPIMRPVFLQYPRAESFYGNGRDFLFGPDLLVSPVVSEALDAHPLLLPPGEWYGFEDGQRHAGGEKLSLRPGLDALPLYVRAGAVLPMQPLVQSTAETPTGPLQLHAYLPSGDDAGDCGGSLYQDDGESFAYRHGEYLRIGYRCTVEGRTAQVAATIVHDGYRPWWTQLALTVHGIDATPREVRVDGAPVEGWRYDASTGSVALAVADPVRDWNVAISW